MIYSNRATNHYDRTSSRCTRGLRKWQSVADPEPLGLAVFRVAFFGLVQIYERHMFPC